ncbi:MAG: hypothetical protein A2Y62_13645 [Candidatus Fischerbacteria bacterium RBG_13_37_8]|uniref:Uncharacterized protein n=1 Tax=Candidatus Fischerbacteria bacterium RBG_13_37_8 TaxID=1817863 RepID=A0A1F5V7B4_9BACT|nr:MAG: hypothetical protein A2Y62_13645 [Candidatus Fischerbacteria bacterium RBG_13_37_8]
MESNGETLSTQVIKSGFWVFSFRAIIRILGLIKLMILARLLSPADFGIMGLALAITEALETFSQPDFQQALIQKKERIDVYLDSTWTFLIFRRAILFIILILIAPYLAQFFNIPGSQSVFQVIAITQIIQAFSNIGIVFFHKELHFKKQFSYEVAGSLANFIVAVIVAFFLRNVWALILGLLAGNLAKSILSYKLHPWRPHFCFNFSRIKELWEFGKWLMGRNMLVFFISNGDSVIIGKILGSTQLGFYQMASNIANLPSTEITQVSTMVTFPAYSKLQDNLERVKEAYFKVLHFIAFISTPIAGAIYLFAFDFTRIFLGDKWLPVVPIIQVLVFAGLIRSLGETAGPIFYSLGKTKIVAFYQVIRLVVLAAVIFPLTIAWGIKGTAIAVLVNIIIANAVYIIMCNHALKCGYTQFGKIIIVPLFATIVTNILIWITIYYITINLLTFIMLTIFYVIIYCFILYLLRDYYDSSRFILLKHLLFR